MLTECLVCKENTKNIDVKMIKTKIVKLVFSKWLYVAIKNQDL